MKRIFFLGLGLLLAAQPVQAKITLPLLFSDGAVVQRDQPLTVWGWAKPGAKIAVSFDGRGVEATSASDGAWRVELPAHAAGGPYLLKIAENGGDALTVRDVLVGDVWLASGQSNMEWPGSQAANAQAEIAAANDPLIRHFKIPKSWAGRAAGATGRWRMESRFAADRR